MSQSSALDGLVSSAAVRAHLTASSWEDAIEQAGSLLVNTGACTRRYVAAMRDAVTELGPYMVVAPGVAMPHARPEAGVLRPGLAVVTLTQPVRFGHATNDPVDLVIAFAAVDKAAHLETLQRIVALLQDDAALTAARAAATDQALQAALQGQGSPSEDLK